MMNKCVYAMVTAQFRGARWVKYGKSNDVVPRVKAVQTGCPVPIEMCFYVAVPNRTIQTLCESHMHKIHASRHSSGEWFVVDDCVGFRDVFRAQFQADARVVVASNARVFEYPMLDPGAARARCSTRHRTNYLSACDGVGHVKVTTCDGGHVAERDTREFAARSAVDVA